MDMNEGANAGFSSNTKATLMVACVFAVVASLAIFGAYKQARSKPGSIVLPAGINYLGPIPSQTAHFPISQSAPLKTITIDPSTPWIEYKGILYPYAFSHPESLSLGFFPNDPFDSVAIFWGNTPAQENLFIRVEDLNRIPNMTEYVAKPKILYAQNWWKQYNWKDLAEVTEFTNKRGLKGYRAKYLNQNDQTPFDNVFFEVPQRPDLVIWMTGKLLDQSTFDKIVDSVSWGTLPTPAP
ncbi:hypothetical protein KKC61_00880 [Patescibacteria group bacterium]|nr:hypothetical protein [Patescibacteria group bacterium]